MMLRKWEDIPEEMRTDAVKKYYDILYKKRFSLLCKRVFDVTAAAVMLLILSPVFLLLAVAIKLDSKGPVFYRQVRVTRYGKLFRIFKFRSMVSDADKIGSQVTVGNDSRITRVGRLIRKCRLDEICQLIDVLRGTMTFVGTRPEVPKYVEQYTPEMMATLLLPAGVTSETSIYYKDEDELLSGAEDVDKTYVEAVLPGKMYYNLKAIEKFSFLQDIRVMFMTVFAVLGKEYKAENAADRETEERAEEEKDMTKGLVSVIMPTYNCGRFITETIQSIQVQTYENWEIVIVDDCSTDDTKAIVAELAEQDGRIRYHCLEVNSGAAVARTEAMKLAEGEYMAFCDSDDLWLPRKLEKQLAFMQDNGYAFSCTAYEQIDEESNSLGRVIKTVEKTDYNRLLLDCPVGNSTVMYSVEKMGKFEVPNIRKRNDDALWLQMLKKEKYIWGMPDVLMRYRIRSNSISSNKLKVIKYHWILYREIEHLSVIRSLFHVCCWCFLKVFRIK